MDRKHYRAHRSAAPIHAAAAPARRRCTTAAASDRHRSVPRKPRRKPGYDAPFDLLTCGRCGRRTNIMTSAAPASSAVAAQSNADAPAPSTPTRRPTKSRRIHRRRRMQHARPRAAALAWASPGKCGNRSAPAPSRPPASTTLWAHTSSRPDAALERRPHTRHGRLHRHQCRAVLDCDADRIAHPQQVVAPVDPPRLVQSRPTFNAVLRLEPRAERQRRHAEIGARQRLRRAQDLHARVRPPRPFLAARIAIDRANIADALAHQRRRRPSARTCRRRRPAHPASAGRQAPGSAVPSWRRESSASRDRGGRASPARRAPDRPARLFTPCQISAILFVSRPISPKARP